MAALWVSVAAVGTLVLTWRLRRASGKLDRILREERELSERQATAARDVDRAENSGR
jgi:hypothetical protein